MLRENGQEGMLFMITDHESIKISCTAYESCFVVKPDSNHNVEIQINYREIVRTAQWEKYLGIDMEQKCWTFKGEDVHYPRAVIERMRAYGVNVDADLQSVLRIIYRSMWTHLWHAYIWSQSGS